MFNQQEIAVQIAKKAYTLLQLESEIVFLMDIYQGSGMANAVFQGATVTPNAIYAGGLTYAEIEGARLALEGLTTYLNANTEVYRNDLTKVVSARNN